VAVVTSVIVAALVTNITIDFVVALVTFVTKFRNVPVDTFAVMVILVTKVRNVPMGMLSWLLSLPMLVLVNIFTHALGSILPCRHFAVF